MNQYDLRELSESEWLVYRNMKKHNIPTSTGVIVDRICRESQITPVEVRSALWSLVARDLINFDDMRKLRLAEKGW